MQRLLEGLPGGQRFGTFAGTAVVVAVVVAAVAVVAVGSAAAAVAVAAAGMGCGFPASHTPSPVAVAPAKRAERRPGSGGSSLAEGSATYSFLGFQSTHMIRLFVYRYVLSYPYTAPVGEMDCFSGNGVGFAS